MKRWLPATSMLAALLLGLLAVPAAAQDSPGPDDVVADDITALECAFGTALVFEEERPDSDATATLLGLLPEPDADGIIDVHDLDADGQQALVDAAFAALADIGRTFADVCAIYTPAVAGIVIDDEEPDDEVAAVEEVVDEDEEPAVAADVLAVSGVNSAGLAVVGILLLGLGFVAVRRTRDASSS